MKLQRTASLSYIVISFLVLFFKFMAYYKTKSGALFADAIETLVNVAASLVSFWAIYMASKPKDENHPYGHGKFEYLSSSFEGGMVFIAGLGLFIESVRLFLQPRMPENLNQGLLWVSVGSFLNLALGLYLYYVGKKTQSVTIKASSVHVLSDIATTVGSMIGFTLAVTTGLVWFDSVSSLVVAVLLLVGAFRILRSSLAVLVDEQDDVSLEELARAFSSSQRPGIIDIHDVRMIRSGNFHHIDAHVVVPRFWDIQKSHDFLSEFEAAVVREYHLEGEIAFHLDPCRKEYCQNCQLAICPLRTEPFQAAIPLTKEKLKGSAPVAF